MSKTFWQAVKDRRSQYGFSNEEIVPKDRIETIVSDALLHVPSPFNSQSTRIVLLFGSDSRKFWSLTIDALSKVVDAEQLKQTKAKIDGAFASGYGTVLFFEDQAVVDGLVSGFPTYADRFPVWSQHTNAMHQFAVWTALEAEGLGASLQHYNPLVDDAVKSTWGIDANWRLIAQMPFGKPLSVPDAKEFTPLDGRLKVFGKD